MGASRKCSNCGKEIPAAAKACKHCEADLQQEPTEEEKQYVKQMLDEMDPESRSILINAVSQADSAEELIRSVFVGSCPRCDSENTGDCENDPEIDNPLVGRCFDCHFHWCTECGRTLDPQKPDCPCWDEDIPGLPDF